MFGRGNSAAEICLTGEMKENIGVLILLFLVVGIGAGLWDPSGSSFPSSISYSSCFKEWDPSASGCPVSWSKYDEDCPKFNGNRYEVRTCNSN